MSQHQTGFAGVPVKRLKQMALIWKVKDNTTSQLARNDARLAVSGVNQWGQGDETVLPKVLTEGTAALTPPKVQTSEDNDCVTWDSPFCVALFLQITVLLILFMFINVTVLWE